MARRTTQNYLAFVPGSSSGALLNLKTMNQPPSDVLTIWLAQVNADAVTDLNVFHAASADDPGPATAEEIDARTYVSGSDDRVLLVPEFTYGTEKFPATPQTTFEAVWDTGAVSAVEVRRPVRNGHVVLVLSIPRMKTGRHSVMVKAKLPSGRTYSSQAVDLYVHEQIVYLDVDGVFDVSAPVDDLPSFVPGSDLQGRSVDLLASGQKIIARVVVPKGGPGEVRAELTNVTRWPGIAMNAPLASSDTSPDLVFESGFSGTVAIQRDNQPRLVDVPILVRDYAAGGTLKVTIPSGRTTRTVSVTLPIDTDGNRIPDNGWYALSSSTTGTVRPVGRGIAATSDTDLSPEVSGFPTEGSTGDGLTAAEEYRGFMVRGFHRRLNPERKDLFILTTAVEDSIDSRLLELPVAIHEIQIWEAVVNAEQGAPEINPNRGGFAGSSRQRGLRIRLRRESPEVVTRGGIVRAHKEYFGRVVLDGENPDRLDDIDAFSIELKTPNETQFCDIYEKAFLSQYISFGEFGILESEVYLCPTYSPCDIVNHEGKFVQATGDVLVSTPAGNDFYTSALFKTCPRPSFPVEDKRELRVLSSLENFELMQTILLHEVLHGLDVEHDLVGCSASLMAVDIALPAFRGMTPNDAAQIRIHRKRR